MMASCLHAQAIPLLLSTYHSYCINPLLICACIPCSFLAWPEAVLAPALPEHNLSKQTPHTTYHTHTHSQTCTNQNEPPTLAAADTTTTRSLLHIAFRPLPSCPALLRASLASHLLPSALPASGLHHAPYPWIETPAKAGSSRTRTRQRIRLPGVSHTHIGGGLCFVAFTIYLLHAHTPTTRSLADGNYDDHDDDE